MSKNDKTNNKQTYKIVSFKSKRYSSFNRLNSSLQLSIALIDIALIDYYTIDYYTIDLLYYIKLITK